MILPVAPTGRPADVREGKEEEEVQQGVGENGATFEMYFETYPAAVLDKSDAANATDSAAAAAAAAAPTVLLLNPTGGCTDGKQTIHPFNSLTLPPLTPHPLIRSLCTQPGA